MTTKQRIAVAVAQGHTTVDQVARLLSLPKATVLHLVERSELVQVGFGNALQLTRDAVIVKEAGQVVEVGIYDSQS
jgi:hypothetical protein